jgi:hypothetical protein
MSDTKEEFSVTITVPIDSGIINQAVWGCEDSQWSPWFPSIRYDGDDIGDVASVTVICWDPNKEEGEVGNPIILQASAIADAIGQICRGEHGNGYGATDIKNAVLANEAGDIDALGSDIIMQVACYGEIIFG